MTDLTPEKRAELRAAVEERHLFRFVTERGSDGYPSSGLLEIGREVLALLDAADLLDEVRDQVRRGALCPMCSTGMTRQTVGLICQLCGTDYDKESTR